ncbi:MAG TPA: hypothetical protein V6D17_17080 [Candidatus Obscuribacterales bacterium]
MSEKIRQSWEDTWSFLSDEHIAENARRSRQFRDVWSKISFDQIAQRTKCLQGAEKEIWEVLWQPNSQSMSEKHFVFQMGLWAHTEPSVRKMLISNEILTAGMFAQDVRARLASRLGFTSTLLDKIERALLVKLLYSPGDISDRRET